MTGILRIAGAMSGTSADGVDVAVCSIAGSGVDPTVKLLGFASLSYADELRQLIHTSRSTGSISLRDFARIGRMVALVYVDTVREACASAGIRPEQLDAVAAHGQTLFHDPPLTIQQFDPAVVAHALDCPVVSDFRRADLAAGGQGAPLVPLADYALFRSREQTRLLLNIGGIANLTFLPKSAGVESVRAFDTGPGNCLSDAVSRSAGRHIDVGGKVALSGTAHLQIVNEFLSDPFFHQSPPRSTDGPAMVTLFQQLVRSIAPALSIEDQLATAARIVATSVRQAVDRFLPASAIDQVVVAGGGVFNAAIDRELCASFSGVSVVDSASLGIPVDQREAIAFAVLGAATLTQQPSNLPSVTGAAGPVVLGSVTPRPRPDDRLNSPA
jgi:anhydro-N-acetylmuramic acid kinase